MDWTHITVAAVAYLAGLVSAVGLYVVGCAVAEIAEFAREGEPVAGSRDYYPPLS